MNTRNRVANELSQTRMFRCFDNPQWLGSNFRNTEKTLPDALRSHSKIARFTQEELADRAALSPKYIGGGRTRTSKTISWTHLRASLKCPKFR
jgi:hypothetical protein